MNVSGRTRTDSPPSPTLKLKVRKALEGVLCSAPFHSSKQLQTLLRHLVERTLDGQEELLKERLIGVDVFGRPTDYNTGDDPVVRLRVGDVRKRLAQYYQSDESRGASLEISIPPGSYQAHFQDCTLDASGPGIDQVPVAAPPQSAQLRNVPLAWVAVACIATLILGILGTRTLAGLYKTKRDIPNAATVSNPILHRILSPGTTINVVLADANLATLLEALKMDSISLGDYKDTRYPGFLLDKITDPVVRAIVDRDLRRRYTPLGDTDVATKCAHWATIVGSPTEIRYARYMEARDFEQGNWILVGDRLSNPWISLFEPKLNFYQEKDTGDSWFHFRNRHPRPGESQTYGILNEGGGSYIGYVDIAILPNTSGTGSVLLLNGLWGDMSRAAADMIFKNDLPPALSHALKSESNSSTTEILLRVHFLNGAQWQSEIVSIRTSTP